MPDHTNLSRRHFLRTMLAAGAGTLLAACGAQPTTEAPAGADPTTAPAPSAAPAAPSATSAPAIAQTVEITHWDWWVTQGPWVDNEIALFQQANPGVVIKKTTQGNGTYEDLFSLAQRDGSGPDVFLIPNKPSFQEQAANGWLADLSLFAGYQEFVARFPNPRQQFIPGVNIIEGQTLSAPFGSPAGAMWNQLWINTKVFKDAGLVDDQGEARAPTTIAEMLEFARTINAKSNGSVYGYGVSLNAWTVSMTYHLAQLSGGDADRGGLDYRSGTYRYSSIPAYQTALETLLTMRDEGLIIPDSASVDDEAMRVLFAQHAFGMMINGNWVINGWKETNPDFSEFMLAPMPLIGATAPSSYYYAQPGGKQFGISTNARDSEAAWAWLQWLYSPEAGERWVQSGNGMSIFPQANKPEYADTPAMREYFRLSPQYVRFGPQPGLRNPDAAQVKLPAVKPDESEIVRGLFTGQLTDAAQVLRDLDAAKQQALETAIADAQAAGAKVSIDDFIFADWDPTKDYVNQPA